uniref:Uncharacterized protein n=1 Tax=Salix viminalis TaxID=40686 RepID=A0A6N2KJZ9_SALVM
MQERGGIVYIPGSSCPPPWKALARHPEMPPGGWSIISVFPSTARSLALFIGLALRPKRWLLICLSPRSLFVFRILIDNFEVETLIVSNKRAGQADKI